MRTFRNVDDAYEYASSMQEGFSKEEFVDCMKKLQDLAKQEELSDEDLDAVAGGSGTGGAVVLSATEVATFTLCAAFL